MRRLRLHRLIAFLATFALFLATSVYLAHSHLDDAGPQGSPKCEYCLQLTGTAGPAEPTGVIVRALVVERLPARQAHQVFSSRRASGNSLPRAPPVRNVI